MVPLNGRSEGTYDDGTDLGTGAFTRPVHDAPPAGPQPMAGPAPVAAHLTGGIQGPMAGPLIGGPAAGGPPHAPYGGMPDEGRATSSRVFMVILAFVLMVCGAILAVAMVLLIAVFQDNQPQPLPPIDPIVAPPPLSEELWEEEPDEEPIEPPKPPPRPPQPPPRPPTQPPDGPPTEVGTDKEPPGAPGLVTVTLPAGVRASSMEVTCDGGAFRERARFTGRKAQMANVPAGSCTLVFVGMGTKKAFKFSGSHNFVCSGVGSNILCR